MASPADVQKLFLQAILSRRVVSVNLAKVLWKKCVDAVKVADDSLDIPWGPDKNAWDDFISRINESLNPIDLELASSTDEKTGRQMFALVNRNGDEVAQMATDYSPLEIAYFKALVEQIMLAPNYSYSISSMAALREVNSLKSNMTKTQAENVLASFVAKGWLLKPKKGRYSLSTRTLLELQPYIRQTYPDEKLECTVCMEIVTRGTRCYTSNCKIQLHGHCMTAYRKTHSKCPSCNTDWSKGSGAEKLLLVGENAAPKDDGRAGRGGRAQPRQATARKMSPARARLPRRTRRKTNLLSNLRRRRRDADRVNVANVSLGASSVSEDEEEKEEDAMEVDEEEAAPTAKAKGKRRR
ncbi:hypothetical protein EWM64_g2245 [Hericium alpestre]|uniref:Non-structural maintenance of chromosomes element 1 homolog n=1 Tax=Hericium alpestre TaxID=135208 RepID=A0A4Z0A5Y9_9AGAM|nr:hypothetical protein EWM64_g2245 [Hericium alpestre]